MAALCPTLFTLGALQLALGEVHLTADRNGTFALHRRGVVAVVRAAGAFAAVLAGLIVTAVLATLVGTVGIAILGALFWVYFGSYLLGSVLLISSRRRGTALTDVGPETPKGRRWSVGSLAQRPGTRWSALEAVRDRIAALPPGSVVVAVAATEPLQRVYVRRGGFTKGDKLRIYRVIE